MKTSVSTLITGCTLLALAGTNVLAAGTRSLPPVIESVSVAEQESKANKEFLVWKKATDKKIKKLERVVSNQALITLLQKIDQLTNDVNQLRGITEEQAHHLSQLADKQKKIYLAQDQRLTDLEERPISPSTENTINNRSSIAPLAPSLGTDFSNAPINQESKLSTPEEKQAYQAAFTLVLKAKYEEAITALEDFLVQHPSSAYSDNALYWLGEANYATERYATALKTFTNLMQRYPRSNKIPGAILKTSFCYYELKQWTQSKNHLLHLIKAYPKHSTVPLAKKRLQLLNSEGH